MTTSPSPPQDPAELERRRLARLELLAVLDTGPEPMFDALVRVAAAVCGQPIALLSLIDADRQWFKANVGLEGCTQTAREVAFCDHAIREDGVMQVPDATRDPRFVANPLVTGDPNIRFYAGAPITMPGGERIGALCVMGRVPARLTPQQEAVLRDLAEAVEGALLQRQRVRELNESTDRALSVSRLALWELELASGTLYLSESWAELLGRPRAPTTTTLPELLQLVPEEEREALQQAWRALLEGEADHYVVEHRVRRADGSRIWVHSEGRVTQRDARGRALHAAGTKQDVTVRRQAEAESEKARQAAEAANRAKSDFLDNVSHEIRTPLNGVLGLTRLLLAEPLTQQQRKYVQLADASASSLLELISDLLDLGKIEAGRMELEDTPFRLDELLAQLGEMYRLRAGEKGLHFELEVGADVPASVCGDAGRLRQILNNLLSNAFKFTERGEFGLIVGRAEASRGPDVLRFTVYDTGIGIPYETQQRLFTRFTQGDRSTSRKYGGTGLGLAIVKQLVGQMGGSVLLQSEPGRGASFRCELPLKAARTPAPVRQPPPARSAAPNRAARILVAEDHPTNQVVVRGLLAQAGYREVTVVDDGQEAVEAALVQDFDLVLMDCRMPVLDGYAASMRLRAQGFTAPIIALTANAAIGERERCLAHGMNDYLAKPVDAGRLAQVLAEWTLATDPPAQPLPPAPGPAEPEPGAGTRFQRRLALERLGGDEELLAVALASFREHAPKVLAAARAAHAAARQPELHRHLHSLAGSAGMVGADPLKQAAKVLEEQAGAGRLDAVAAGLGDLEALVEEFLETAAAW